MERQMTSLYLMCQEECLLLHRQGSRVADNKWIATAGGHLEPEELGNARACVLRELQEECGLSEHNISDLQLRYITLRQTKGEIRMNYFFFATLKEKRSLQSNEGELRWVAKEQLLEFDMPLTAKQVLSHYLTIGQFERNLYAGVIRTDAVDFHVLN